MPRFSAGEREIIRQRLMREGERLFAAFGVDVYKRQLHRRAQDRPRHHPGAGQARCV